MSEVLQGEIIRRLALLLIMITLIQCSDKNKTERKLEGQYQGFANETLYVVDLKANDHFEFKINGHQGDIVSSGRYEVRQDTLLFYSDQNSEFLAMDIEGEKYLIDKDSCLINIWTRYDLCKNIPKDISWSSQRRNIYYPYLVRSDKEKEGVAMAFNLALNAPDIKPYTIDKADTVFLKTYHLLNDDFNSRFDRFDLPVAFLSHDSPAQPTIEILDINMQDGLLSISLQQNVPLVQYSVVFTKVGDNWQIIKTTVY